MSFLFLLSRHSPPACYPLSLHDALPISTEDSGQDFNAPVCNSLNICLNHNCSRQCSGDEACPHSDHGRSEEHTSELQSRGHLVCRLLLEKKNKIDRRGDIGDTAIILRRL